MVVVGLVFHNYYIHLTVTILKQLTGCTCSEVPPPPIEPEYIDEVDTKHLT